MPAPHLGAGRGGVTIFSSLFLLHAQSRVLQSINPARPQLIARGNAARESSVCSKDGETGETGKKQSKFSLFVHAVQPQILRNYPRQSSASVWHHLDLRKPKFDRFC